MGENNHKRTRSNRKTSEPHKPCMNLEDAVGRNKEGMKQLKKKRSWQQ